MVNPIPDYDFDKNFNNLTNTSFDPVNLTNIAAAPYTDIFGTIFWGIVFSLVFVMIWERQEDITIPAILGLVIGSSIWGFFPPDWLPVAMSLTVVSFAGMMYSLIKGRY